MCYSGLNEIHLTSLSCSLDCSMGETVAYMYTDVEKMYLHYVYRNTQDLMMIK